MQRDDGAVPPGWNAGSASAERLRIWCGCREPVPDLRAGGWRLRHVEDELRLVPHRSVSEVALPDDVRRVAWAEAREDEAFAVYEAAFRARPGFPGWTQERWLAWGTQHETFHPEGSCLLIVGGKPAAFLWMALEPPQQPCDESAAWIVQMGVVPDFRRRGLGRRLLGLACAGAITARADSLHLSASLDNSEARALYDAEGFCFHRRWASYEAVAPA